MNTNEHYKKYADELQQEKPAEQRAGNPGARVLDAIRANETLTAVKPFKASGQSYQPGDEIEAGAFPADRAAALGDHGYIVPSREINKAYAVKAKYFKQVLSPAHEQVIQAVNDLDAARAAIVQAETRLKAAQEAEQNAARRLANVEAEYKALAEGEAV